LWLGEQSKAIRFGYEPHEAKSFCKETRSKKLEVDGKNVTLHTVAGTTRSISS
jgi:hypothetical protein